MSDSKANSYHSFNTFLHNKEKLQLGLANTLLVQPQNSMMFFCSSHY